MFDKVLQLSTHFLFATVMVFAFTACDDTDNDGEPDPGNGNGNGDNNEIWEPYKFKENTTYEYDYVITEEEETTMSGTAHIQIGDPEVTVNWNMNDEDYETVVNQSDDIADNYVQAIASTPLAGILYQGQWAFIFTGNELAVGNSWDYESDDGTMYFEVTGKESYAGIEGFIMEMYWDDNAEDVVTWESCIAPEMSLPLMSYMDDTESETTMLVELTNYQE